MTGLAAWAGPTTGIRLLGLLRGYSAETLGMKA